MKTNLLITFLLTGSNLFAPASGTVFIVDRQPVYYDPMLLAFMEVESNFRTDVVNSLGCAGILQISEVMIAEVNRIQKIKSFTLTDRLDSTMSVEVWYIIQNHYNRSYGLKNAIKLWNPTAGKSYFNKINKRYERHL